MFTTFLNNPVSFGAIIRKAETRRIDLKQSIHNMLHLILTTSFGEVKHDPFFGCEIWQFDFENIYNPHSFKEDLKRSLQNSIRKNEKRLSRVTVDLQIEQLEISTRIKNKRIKTRIVLLISGLIEKTNEEFLHQEVFFIGPLSYS
jgi:phage baseplate assembly protein W